MKLKNGQEGCLVLISRRAVRRSSSLADGWTFIGPRSSTTSPVGNSDFSSAPFILWVKMASSSCHSNGLSHNCQFVLNLVEGLHKQFKTAQIAILNCYQAQYRCYASGLTKMSKVYPKIAKQVLTDKIDRRQGSEWDIVVVDLTRSQG